MDKDKQKSFARRVSQANRTELVVITYDIILEELAEAQQALQSASTEEYRHELKLAQRYLAELMGALDFRYKISLQLMSLYEYIQRLLVRSDVSGIPCEFDEIRSILTKLSEAFSKVAESDDSGAVMLNAQTIVAGLTYGRGSLNETNMEDPTRRGFLA